MQTIAARSAAGVWTKGMTVRVWTTGTTAFGVGFPETRTISPDSRCQTLGIPNLVPLPAFPPNERPPLVTIAFDKCVRRTKGGDT